MHFCIPPLCVSWQEHKEEVLIDQGRDLDGQEWAEDGVAGDAERVAGVAVWLVWDNLAEEGLWEKP